MSIEDVKRVSIIDVAQRLGIEVHGDKALCFAHEERTPSLSFNTRDNYFKCFGCGIKGTVIDLVMAKLGLSFQEAVRWMESEYGLYNQQFQDDRRANVQSHGKTDKTQQRAFLEPLRANGKQDGREFSALYRELLNLGDTEEATAYLAGRGIGEDITRAYGIRTVHPHTAQLLAQRHDADTLLASGLFKTGKDGRLYYTLTRHRLVIPYLDRDGQTVLTLQGRDIDGASNHKYQMLVGIETVPYNLRALERSGTLYLCEGAIDVLSALQLGLDSPVGFAGVNNFKDEYYGMLEPYRLIVASDADGAGKEFHRNVYKRFLKMGKKVEALKWSKLKADYGIPDDTQVKDLNDIARLADYDHKKGTGPKRVYSRLLGETCTVLEDGVLFDSGIRYDREELERIIDFDEDMLQAVHLVKTTFNGRITG